MIISLVPKVTWSKGLVLDLSDVRGCQSSSMLDLYESSSQQSFTSINSIIIHVLARLGSKTRDCHVKYDLSHSIKLLAEELKVAVEVDKQENGWFSRESLCRAIKSVMDDEESKNHAKWKDTLTSQGFMSNYIDNFVGQFQDLLDHHKYCFIDEDNFS